MECLHFTPEQAKHSLRGVDAVFDYSLPSEAPAKFKDRRQLGGFGGADSLFRGEFRHGGSGKLLQGAVALQKLAPEIDGAEAGGPGAEENRQQFRI
ncbi:MAG: hypothetical protein R3F31_03875 [Verrucomicrobiales bacterium]